MRNLIYAINITLDGRYDHTKIGGSEEILEYYTNQLQDVGLFVYGRITYELMVPYWPDVVKDESSTKAEIDYAEAFNAIDKVVFSQSLQSVNGNDKIVRDNLGGEILKLKQQPGKNILVGGVNLPSQLIELDLIDEYRILVYPVILGEGKRLFDGISLQQRLQLKLIESTVLKSGAVVLRYVRQ